MTAPAYTDIPDSALEANKPILASTAQETKDNLLSVAGGGVGAPRIALLALERLFPGDEIRSRHDGVVIPNGAVAFNEIHAFAFTQIGSIRVVVQRLDGVAENMRARLTRNGVTTIEAGPSSTELSADIDVIPGDLITIEGEANSTASITYNARFSTDGGNLWPAGAARVEGNTTA